ncbi:MAG TPA: lysylphosphatidylglycerol synthase transmembrane domain-containing protein [Candidatus Dormibacteraeota bacterium]|nr:lysylphosphatidylglycerol synthase transmembrane domain-containing protein [Candidatus Dormibacteraeota bacterium]
MSTTLPQAPGQAPARGHVRLSVVWGRLHVGRARDLHLLRRVLPPAIGVAAVLALVLGIDPQQFGRAVEHLRLPLLPAVVAVSLAYYLLQGVRWHQLLRAVGVPLRLGQSVLINLAGQATAVLPLGELTRAVLVTEATGTAFGAVVATVTVQELIYTMVLIVFAVPGLLAVPHALPGVVAALLLTALVFVAMSWCPAYRWLRAAVSHTPGVRRFLDEVDELHNDMVLLLRHRDTLLGAWISALQAAFIITSLWLVAAAVDPGALSWRGAALVFAVSNVAGALSLIPGGIGAYEASVVGLLVGLGMNPGTAAAVALLQRLTDKGLATAIGFGSYAVARRRLGLSGLGTLPVRRPLERAA